MSIATRRGGDWARGRSRPQRRGPCKACQLRAGVIESACMTDMTDLLRYRDLVLALVARDLKARYRRSALGFVWPMLQPLLMMLVLRTVFSTLFQAKSAEVPDNYAVFV